MPAVDFEGQTPILAVRDLPTSVDYYVNTLGFRVDWQDPHVIASVSRGRCAIFLVEGDQGNPGTWVWVGVSDAAALHDEYVGKGAKIRHPPANFPWAYEMQVEDPDGNVLRMGSEPRDDQPPGEWLDMRGVTWRQTEEGWKR